MVTVIVPTAHKIFTHLDFLDQSCFKASVYRSLHAGLHKVILLHLDWLSLCGNCMNYSSPLILPAPQVFQFYVFSVHTPSIACLFVKRDPSRVALSEVSAIFTPNKGALNRLQGI